MRSKSMISAAQIRAARALLDASRHQLAELSGVGHSTLADFENGKTASMLTTTAAKIIATFADVGVVLIDADKQHGSGVCFKDAEAEREAAIKFAAKVEAAKKGQSANG